MTGGKAVQPIERSNGASVDCHGRATLLAPLVGESGAGRLTSLGIQNGILFHNIQFMKNCVPVDPHLSTVYRINLAPI
jgi:hypothetical protein